MASVLAIISKSVFEKLSKNAQLGDVLAIDRYTTSNAAFERLGSADGIFLVTVRPPKEALWLVAIVETPKRKKNAWVGRTNTTPIADVSGLIEKLELASGQGIRAKKGALGMSLQTPRVLTAGDVALLRGKKRSGLRLANHRSPLETLRSLPKAHYRQLAQLTKQNRAGTPEDVVNDDAWAGMELVDVVDEADTITHQLYLWPYGSGELFANNTTKSVARIIQHVFRMETDDAPFRRALEAAFANAKPKLQDMPRFEDPTTKEAEYAEEQRRLSEGMKRIAKELGSSKERYRLFEDLSKSKRASVVDFFGPIKEGIWLGELAKLGLPPLEALRRWAGIDPPTLLEKKVGRWPAWKWLKAAAREDIEPDEAIRALTKELTAREIMDAIWLALLASSGEEEGYDLFDVELEDKRGESAAERFAERVLRFLGALVDGAGPDAAIDFAARCAKESPARVEAIATFALAARARRREEPFPKRFLKVAAKAEDMGRSMREIVELIPMDQREAFLDDYAPVFGAYSNTERRKGREVEVPCLGARWLFVDLVPTEAMAKGAIASIEAWDRYPKPKQQAIDALVSIGPVCIPHLEKAIKKSKSPYKSVFVGALKHLDV